MIRAEFEVSKVVVVAHNGELDYYLRYIDHEGDPSYRTLTAAEITLYKQSGEELHFVTDTDLGLK